jgi:hypothetical protein
MVKNMYWSSGKVPLFLSDLNKTWIFLVEIPKKSFMKGRQVGAESFQADRHYAGNSRFSQFYKYT